jgi:hypothetical protein
VPLKISNPRFVDEVLKVEKQMINDAKEDIAFAVITYHSLVVAGSPVDTGRYKVSHVFETGSRSSKTNGKNTEGNIKSYKFDFKNGVYYIANNLQYASALEAGRSKQAPNGVYGVALVRLRKAIAQRTAQRNRKVYK